MANFTRLRLPGFWVAGSVVDPAEFEAFDADRPKFINATDGSTHAPSAVITIGGSGLTVSGPATLSNIRSSTLSSGQTLTAVSGSTVDVDPGATLEVGGTATFTSGSTVTKNSSSTWTLNGSTTFGASSIIQGGPIAIATGTTITADFGAFITWAVSNWPALASRTVTRRQWLLAYTTYTAAPAGARAWMHQALDETYGKSIQTSSETAVNYFLIEFFNLPPGATMNTVVVTSTGTAGLSSTTVPFYRLVRWQKNTAVDFMSDLTADSHTGANWAATTLDTTITANANQTIDAAYHYGVRVSTAHDAGGASGRFYDFVASLTATTIQL